MCCLSGCVNHDRFEALLEDALVLGEATGRPLRHEAVQVHSNVVAHPRGLVSFEDVRQVRDDIADLS